jgi:hypothetical protein
MLIKVESNKTPKRHLQCKHFQRFGYTQHNCGCASRCVALGDAHPSGKCVTPMQQLKCCSCGGNDTAKCRGCNLWKDAKAGTTKRARSERGRNGGVSTRLPATKAAPPNLSSEQGRLGYGWNHVVQGGCVVQAQVNSIPTPTSSELCKLNDQHAVGAGRQERTAGPEALVVESKAPCSKQADLTPSTPPSQSPLEETADLLEKRPTEASRKLTRRLLSTVSSLPTGKARPRTVLKTVILFSSV